VAAAVSGLDVARSSATSRHIVETAAQHGLDSVACLSGTGVSSEDLLDPEAEILPAQELAIIRNVIGRLGNRPGLGMEAGSRYNLADTGILGYALLASPTFGDAIEVAWRYIALSASYLSLAAPEVVNDEAVVAIDDTQVPTDVRQFLIERDFAMTMRLFPVLIGTNHPPMAFRLQLANLTLPTDQVDFGNVRVAVESGSRSALIFPARLVDQPMPAADPQTAAICIRQCEQLLNRRRSRRGIAGDVRMRMIADSARIPSMAEVARELCITERTLHRRLTAEGTSFRALLDEVRATLAAELLDSGLTIEETARRLGYSETAAFTRAHTRWNGRPPSRRLQRRGTNHHDGFGA
jgi:AraC-like DNA-binding protein